MQVHLDMTDADIAAFRRDGFLIRDRIVGADTVTRLREEMERSYQGDYDSGLHPDEVNWTPGTTRM